MSAIGMPREQQLPTYKILGAIACCPNLQYVEWIRFVYGVSNTN
ncbi:hypothetical protein FIU95_13495 [Microbulbifer sp. THAF38]|nr:hypothetical protein FIU95_13495 [Microbulbifer sp. THAF38]